MIPILTISIDRTDLTLPPLVLDASPTAELAIVEYTEPSIIQRVAYAPTSRWIDGDLPLGKSLDKTVLEFTVGPPSAETEQDAADAIDELALAVSRLTYEVTVTTNDAIKVWTCYPGSLTPAKARTFDNLRRRRPVWNVSLPAHPVPA